MAGLNWKPFLCAADNHGDQCDKEAVKRFHEFAADWKPFHRIHLGDLFDLRPLRKGAGADEKAERITEDWVAGQTFLEKFRPDTLILGNHDLRIYEALESNDGLIAGAAQRMLEEFQGEATNEPRIGGFVKKIGIKRMLDHHVSRNCYKVGAVRFLHGFRATMYPARALADNFGPSAICGHVHKFDLHVSRHVEGGMCMTAPCLANLDMHYLRKSVAQLAHDNGWIFGVINERTGKWEAWCVRRQRNENQWIDPRNRWV